MRYESLILLSRQEAIRKLESKDIGVIRRVVAALTTIDDDDWVLKTLLKYIDHSDVWVAGNAVVSLGELGRLGRAGDTAALKTRLVQAGKLRPEIAGRVESAVADLEMKKE